MTEYLVINNSVSTKSSIGISQLTPAQQYFIFYLRRLEVLQYSLISSDRMLTQDLRCFLIHDRRLSSRLSPALGTWKQMGIDTTVIVTCDGDRIEGRNPVGSDLLLWSERIGVIGDILLQNAGLTHLSNDPRVLNTFDWLRPRQLRIGEQSVLLKHYTALQMIANSGNDYSIIAEDDVLAYENSYYLFQEVYQASIARGLEYVDLAGGCNLHHNSNDREFSLENIAILGEARTRSSACYLISRLLAKKLVDLFLPASFPIDWHMQYLFRLVGSIKCGWAIEKPFLHGSETGAVKSWRE